MPTNKNDDILKGKVFICTYPPKEQDKFYEMLSQKGATVLSMPVIEVSPIPYKVNHQIEKYSWVVFTSKNAVHPFAKRYPEVPCKIAALGVKTAEQLEQFNLKPDFVGKGKSADDFSHELMNVVHENDQVLLVLGSLAPDTIQLKLKEQATVERVNVYTTKTLETVDSRIIHMVKLNMYDALIVTSPSAVKAIMKLIGSKTPTPRFLSIGKTTTAAIAEYQIEPLATAHEQSYEGLAELAIQYFESKKQL